MTCDKGGQMAALVLFAGGTGYFAGNVACPLLGRLVPFWVAWVYFPLALRGPGAKQRPSLASRSSIQPALASGKASA
jgi:hypothetical protein